MVSRATKLKKALGRGAEVIEVAAPKPWETADWLVKFLKGRGRIITKDAATALVEAVGEAVAGQDVGDGAVTDSSRAEQTKARVGIGLDELRQLAGRALAQAGQNDRAVAELQDRGARVALVEQGIVGGTCVNVGCVPSKALLRAGEVYHQAGHQPFDGIETSAAAVDLAALVAQKDELVETMRREKYLDLVDAYGFELISGHATFTGPDAVAVDGKTIAAGAYLVATGASPSVPPIEGLAEAGYLTSTTALDLKERPGAIAVIGANAIGLELGQFFLHLGTKVLFFDVLDRIAPFEEPEVSEALAGIEGRISVAGLNGPTQTVVSGDESAVAAVLEHFTAAGRRTRRLVVSHAFHSPHMDAMLAECRDAIAHCQQHVAELQELATSPDGSMAGDDERSSSRRGARSANSRRACARKWPWRWRWGTSPSSWYSTNRPRVWIRWFAASSSRAWSMWPPPGGLYCCRATRSLRSSEWPTSWRSSGGGGSCWWNGWKISRPRCAS